jgi:hypothetical protein
MAVFTAIAAGLAAIGGTILGAGASALAATMVGGAVVGAVAGGVIAAVKGENILKGALLGGLAGAAIGGAFHYAGMWATSLKAGSGVGVSSGTQAAASEAGKQVMLEQGMTGIGMSAVPEEAVLATVEGGVAQTAGAAAKATLTEKIATGGLIAQTAGAFLEEEPEDAAKARHDRIEAADAPIGAGRIAWEGMDPTIAFERAHTKFMKDFNPYTKSQFTGNWDKSGQGTKLSPEQQAQVAQQGGKPDEQGGQTTK